MVAGGVALLTSVPLIEGIGLQALIWGAVDALIAVAGIIGARRKRDRYPDETRAVRETLRLRRVLVINGVLDHLYLAAGIAIAVIFRPDAFLVGNGVGIVIQAVFLLFFDLIHAAQLPARPPAWYSAQP